MLLPLPLLLSALLGLLSLALPILGIYSLVRAWRSLRRQRRILIVGQEPGSPRHTTTKTIDNAASPLSAAVLIPLILGSLSILLTLGGGRLLIQSFFPAGQDEPQRSRAGASQFVQGAGNARLKVETDGPADAPTLVFTHGWGMDSTEWYYAKRDLSDRFRLILWDLPGLGESTQPNDRDFSLEALAKDLHAVVATANGKPVILVGHSIGGMINLTFCRLFPETLGGQVAGIVQVDTSFTNPVKTTKGSGISLALQKPVAEPVLHAMIGLSPLIHAMNWASYENGSMHIMNADSAFAGAETWGQVELVSRLQTEASPGVVARGTLAMFHWDATPVLPRVNAPVLVLVGEQDTTTLPWASERMKDTMPRARLVKVAPAAHYSLLEQNKRIDDEIRRFAETTLHPQGK